MAIRRTTSAGGARRRISVLCASALVLAAGAPTATSSAAILAPRADRVQVNGTAQSPYVVHPAAYGQRHDPPPIVISSLRPTVAVLYNHNGVGISITPPLAPTTEAPYLASHRGALLNQPDGAPWDFVEMRAAGFDWVALNVGDHEPRRWNDVRTRAEAAGLEVVPWSRLGHPHLGETREDSLRKLGVLLDAAKAWGTTRPIVNVETEIKPVHLGGLITPEELAHELERAGMDEAGISTEAWLYDVNWLPLTRYAMLLQILPRDNRWAPEEVRKQQEACERRARDYGFQHVGTSVQTYEMADGSQPQPEWFDLSGVNRSVIWGDNVAAQGPGEWQRWSS